MSDFWTFTLFSECQQEQVTLWDKRKSRPLMQMPHVDAELQKPMARSTLLGSARRRSESGIARLPPGARVLGTPRSPALLVGRGSQHRSKDRFME